MEPALFETPKLSPETLDELHSETAQCDQLLQEQAANLRDLANLPEALKDAMRTKKRLERQLARRKRWRSIRIMWRGR
jgi:hypothetical protein